nr:HNH endonuclease family protein [Bifidobacterium aemilianum]
MPGDPPIERLLILLIVAMVLGISLGLILPRVNEPVGRVTGQSLVNGPVADALNALTVNDRVSTYGYKRDSFGYRQVRNYGDDCDVREHVLARDLTNVSYRWAGDCKVASGVLHDPYTGRNINFVRGKDTSTAVQIDHVVALENAWQSGANRWDQVQRYRYGNDMYNLLAVDGQANQEKGSASASDWLPSNITYRCEYAARQIGVKSKYRLTVTSQEKAAMQKVLHQCPAQQLPSS